MMAFMYQAELFCVDCGGHLCTTLKLPPGANPHDESTFDSDDYPKGPYSDGGGEADSPQHCGDCGVHLENPLTPDGIAYVRKALTVYALTGQGRDIILKQWADFYGLEDNYAEEENVQPLSGREAWEYAAQWGSYVRSGDPGACMYSFSDTGGFPDNRHRDTVLRYIRSTCYPVADQRVAEIEVTGAKRTKALIEARYDSARLRRLAAYLKGLDYAS